MRLQRQAKRACATDTQGQRTTEGRTPETLIGLRLHYERHDYTIASVVEYNTCIDRLQRHLGHSGVKAAEV